MTKSLQYFYFPICFPPVVVLFLLLTFPVTVHAETGFTVRPQIGYGYIQSSDSNTDGNLNHVGTRILLNAGATQKYGLELSRFNVYNGDHFNSIGIVLERRLWNSLNTSIGTVGYFHYGTRSENPVGLTYLPDV